MKPPIIDADDSAEHVRRCWECNDDTMWIDNDLGQGFCVSCHHYFEDPDETVEHRKRSEPRHPCPECGSEAYSRKTKTPRWRCPNGHTFDEVDPNE